MKNWIFLLPLLVFLSACKQKKELPPTPLYSDSIEAKSFDGRPLELIHDPPAIRIKKDSLLQIALQNYNIDSSKLENIIWLGRRLSYLTRYREAIAIYSSGIKKHPNAPELYRHRGHRFLSTRQTQKAINDLTKASELIKGQVIKIEPDGLPNRINQPLSSLQFNIWYHLGLAHYLQQDFKEAQAAYEQCLTFSTNPDLLCATTDWLYMTYRRQGLSKKANKLLENISEDMRLVENAAYHKRLLMYKGLYRPEAILITDNVAADRQLDLATQGYGVGNWYLYNGEAHKAVDIFQRILDTSYWPAFGYIAAEADLEYLHSRLPELFE